ncbi:hypothetical protein IU11_09020, partial [Cellulosimicrobium sp. MM]
MDYGSPAPRSGERYGDRRDDDRDRYRDDRYRDDRYDERSRDDRYRDDRDAARTRRRRPPRGRAGRLRGRGGRRGSGEVGGARHCSSFEDAAAPRSASSTDGPRGDDERPGVAGATGTCGFAGCFRM